MTDFLPVHRAESSFSKTRSTGESIDPSRLAEARRAAEKLEATFLAEMLKAAGFGEQENSFSGGIGENQFASFHRSAIAEQLAEAGGIGLAEHILKSMMETKT